MNAKDKTAADLSHVIFRRKFALSLYKNRKLELGEMSFSKDFITDRRGDPYPVLEQSSDFQASVKGGLYRSEQGSCVRLLGQFFPYASYELTADTGEGAAGFQFRLPGITACIYLDHRKLVFCCQEEEEQREMPEDGHTCRTLIASCRPGAFDIYFRKEGHTEYFCTFPAPGFAETGQVRIFSESTACLYTTGRTDVSRVCFYMDSGISQADIRPIRYENGDVMIEQGKIYLSASIRLQEGCFQGIFSWVPGTAQFELTGALFFDAGDGLWAGDVASSILKNRLDSRWYLWVCSFSHGHILGHACFEGDPRFGVNVADIRLMEKAPENTPISCFLGLEGDEDPDFYYDAGQALWYMSICRLDPETGRYRYVFFQSPRPFDGYHCIGQGADGEETGGSFIRFGGERYFVCGNSFQLTSDYRIYAKNGMLKPVFDYPDGGFRGWGTLISLQAGSRTRTYWLTFDRHNGSSYNWSYGNLYCFEADIRP